MKSIAQILALLSIPLLASIGRADVFQWQWVDPSDHSLGKSQSITLCPGGAGIAAGPGSGISGRNLSQAYLYSFNLSGASWVSDTLTDAYFAKGTLAQMFLYQSSAQTADFSQVDAHTANFRFTELSGSNFTDANLQQAHLDFSTLDNANFTRANLTNATMEFSTFAGANFTDAVISGVHFNGAGSLGFTQEQLHQTASFKSRDLRNIWFHGLGDMSGWDFTGGINLNGSSFFKEDLTGARFNGASLSVSFLNAKLIGADLSGASMVKASLEAANVAGANFTGADLTGVNAQSTRWTGANLTGAKIGGALIRPGDDGALTAQQLYSTASYQAGELRNINFSNSDMTGWSFRGIDLSGSNLFTNNLNGSDFSNAKLNGTDLGLARLQGADFSGVSFSNTGLYSTDLRGAKVSDLAGADTTQAIMPDGSVHGLGPRELFSALNVVNYHGSPSIAVRITDIVNRPFRVRFFFDNNPWHSTVSFNPGILVDFTDTSLIFTFDVGVQPSALFGQTYHVFDWNGVNRIGQFDLSSASLGGYQWDFSRLYSDGSVTLLGVPEPLSVTLSVSLAVAHLSCRRWRRSR